MRGYLIGSGWKDYQRNGQVHAHFAAGGAASGEQLPQPLFTPVHQGGAGGHDENVSFDHIVRQPVGIWQNR